jgi:hypothetical protein
LGGGWFENQPGRRISWLMFFVLSLNSLRQMMGHYHNNLLPHPLKFRITVIPPLDSTQSGLLAVLLNKLHNNTEHNNNNNNNA